MSFTVYPKPQARGAVGTSRNEHEQLYIALGSGSEDDLRAALVAAIARTYNQMPLERIDYDELVDGKCYECTARYQTPEIVDLTVPGTSSYSFAITAATQHITQSRQQVGTYTGPGVFPVDYGGAIGVDMDGTVQGTDIPVPQFAFDETHLFADSAVTSAFKGVIFSLAAKTNAAPFKGLAIGEGLFMGATGGKRADSNWEITFNTAGSPNATNLVIGEGTPYGPITVAAKKGWEYLWVEYVQTEVTVGGGLTPKKRLATVPLQANVERVYDPGDFTLLGIGT